MKKLLVGIGLVCLVLAGCTTPRAAYQAGVNAALQNPNSDNVTEDVLVTAIKTGATSVPEQFSQIQDTGLVHYQNCRNWARNPDGSLATIKVKDQEVPLAEDYETMTKWASMQTLGGGFKKLTLKIGNLLGFDPAVPGTMLGVRDNREGFSFSVDEATGGVSRDAGTIVAKYAGQASVIEKINIGLGTSLEKHWAGSANLIKVRSDGIVAITGAVGGVVKDVVGELSKFTVYGAVASGAQSLVSVVKETQADGTVKDTTVVTDQSMAK